MKNTSRKIRAGERAKDKREKHAQAHLIQDFSFRQAACINRSNASSGVGEVGLADSSAETGRISPHDSILEVCVELGCAPLERDRHAVFESPRGHHFSVLQRDELDSVESARRHLTEVGKDTRSHPGEPSWGCGRVCPSSRHWPRVHHTLVFKFGVLDWLACLDRGGGKAS